jgi:hypothetical protein
MPVALINIIKNMYIQSKGIVVEPETEELYEFLSNMGVKQGDGTSPKLFTIFFY